MLQAAFAPRCLWWGRCILSTIWYGQGVLLLEALSLEVTRTERLRCPIRLGGSQVSELCFQLFITQRCHQDCGDCRVLEELADQ